METETFYQTVKIFENALNERIILNLSRTAETGSISIMESSSKVVKSPFMLVVPYEGVGISSNQQDSYAILQHELSHIIFGSTNKVVLDFFEEQKHKKMKDVMNVLEDDRIEDCLGKLYIGAYQDLQTLKPKICDKDPCIDCKAGTKPLIVHTLAGFRSGISKPCANPDERCQAAQKARDMVLGGKSVKATFVALKLLEQYVDEEDGQQQGGKGKSVPDPNGTPDPNSQPQFTDFQPDIKDNLNVNSKLSDMNKPIDKLLEDAVQEFIQQLSDVQTSLNNTKKKEKVFGKIIDNVVRFEPDRHNYVPDMRIRQLRKFFKDLKFKEQQRGLDEGGELLDIDGLISHKIDNTGEVFQSTESVHGMEVIYLLDVSGSMNSGGSLRIAKQALIDMCELSKGLFDVKVFAFSGHRQDPLLSLVQEIPHKKIANLQINNEYCYTHTHHGVQIASSHFTGGSNKKVLIILTDGMPMSCKHEEKIMHNFAKKAIETSRKQGIKVYTIIVGSDCAKEHEIRYIFGKDSTTSKIENSVDIYRVMKEHTVKNLLQTIRSG